MWREGESCQVGTLEKWGVEEREEGGRLVSKYFTRKERCKLLLPACPLPSSVLCMPIPEVCTAVVHAP